MEKIKVAIIDTGIDMQDSSLRDFYRYKKEFQIIDENFIGDIQDFNSHGTLCAKTIINICPNVEIYPIKIFNKSGFTNSIYLVNTLEKLVDTDIDLINISVSTLNDTNIKELEQVCNKLYEQNKIIIASHHNKSKGKPSYPTAFNSVLGVRGHRKICKDEDYIYKKDESIQMYTNSKYCLYEFNNKITDFGKNSRAAAIATGIIADIYIKYGKLKLKDLEKVLVTKSNVNMDYKIYRFLYKKGYKSNKKKQEIAQKIVTLINENFSSNNVNLEFIEKHSVFNTVTNIYNHNAYEFLQEINKKFNISLIYKDIFLYELDNLYLLVNLIYSYKIAKGVSDEEY